MKVTYQAAARVNTTLIKMERAADAFSNTPELYRKEFWDFVLVQASNPNYAQTVLEEMDALGKEGVSVSKFVSFNMVNAMAVARHTLRNQEILKHSKDGIIR